MTSLWCAYILTCIIASCLLVCPWCATCSTKRCMYALTSFSAHSAIHQVLELDLSTVVPSLSGPKRPHDRVSVSDMKTDFRQCLQNKVSSSSWHPPSFLSLFVLLPLSLSSCCHPLSPFLLSPSAHEILPPSPYMYLSFYLCVCCSLLPPCPMPPPPPPTYLSHFVTLNNTD